ncbi:hypothetical protein K438DRAFT_1760497 [Mycena galopus ATCC 62051]|nr:hypothetical protein K438DRAFT_1760497 [Mycena galopus ATCC 62051]
MARNLILLTGMNNGHKRKQDCTNVAKNNYITAIGYLRGRGRGLGSYSAVCFRENVIETKIIVRALDTSVELIGRAGIAGQKGSSLGTKQQCAFAVIRDFEQVDIGVDVDLKQKEKKEKPDNTPGRHWCQDFFISSANGNRDSSSLPISSQHPLNLRKGNDSKRRETETTREKTACKGAERAKWLQSIVAKFGSEAERRGKELEMRVTETMPQMKNTERIVVPAQEQAEWRGIDKGKGKNTAAYLAFIVHGGDRRMTDPERGGNKFGINDDGTGVQRHGCPKQGQR